MPQERPQNNPEKAQRLQYLRERIEFLTDNVGRSVDEGIKEMVVVLNALELRTTGSCEGGDSGEHGSLAPWIDIGPEEPGVKEWYHNEKLRANVEKELGELKLRIVNFLIDFYRGRNVPYDVMLGFRNIGYQFRLQSIGAEKEVLAVLPEDVRTKRILAYKEEMKKFEAFLRESFLNA